MAEPRFGGDDDLPRTIRRARDARDREMRDRDEGAGMPHMQAPPPHAPDPAYDYGQQGSSGHGVVTRLEIPFFHLVRFFLKAVIAAIPALILLTVVLYGGGQILKQFFPQFRHFVIEIKSTETPPVPAPAPAKK